MFGNICVKCGRTVALTNKTSLLPLGKAVALTNKMSLLPLGKKLITGTSVFGSKWFG